MPNNQIKILVAGHTGLSKLKCIEDRVIPALLAEDSAWATANSAGDQQECDRIRQEKVLVLELEKTIPSMAYSIIGTTRARTNWMSSLNKIRKIWAQKPKHQYVFLLAHLSFQSDSHFHTPIAWTYSDDDERTSFPLLDFLTDEFAPDYVVTFIDDIYSVQSRLSPPNHFRLLELLRWRNLETLFADYVMSFVEIKNGIKTYTDFPFLRSPIFSVKQPVNSLLKYVGVPDTPRVYLSYPISKPLKAWKQTSDQTLVGQINEFRAFFSEQVVVFDPVTINERPIQIAVEEFRTVQRKQRDEKISAMERSAEQCAIALTEGNGAVAAAKLKEIQECCRWFSDREDLTGKEELSLGELWPSPYDKTISPYPPAKTVVVRKSEIDEVITGDQAKSEIDRQIRFRDFRLIDQSDCIVVYRPGLLSSDWSTGTFKECNYALDAARAVIIISGKDDAKPSGPFDHKIRAEDIVTIADSEDPDSRRAAFIEALARVRNYSTELLKKERR